MAKPFLTILNGQPLRMMRWYVPEPRIRLWHHGDGGLVLDSHRKGLCDARYVDPQASTKNGVAFVFDSYNRQY